MKKLSVIISNRNDLSLLAVTVRSALQELKPLEALGHKCEIVVVDNSEPGVWKAVQSAIPSKYVQQGKIKLIRQEAPSLFVARDLAVKESSSEYCLCVDSHVLIGHNMLLDTVLWMDSKKSDQTLGFVHQPLSWAHQHESMARHDRDLSKTELGNWGSAYKYPRTITGKGMPFAFRRNWWLSDFNGYGCLSEHRCSWGGGDLYLWTKSWLLGYQNWAIPTNPIIHIGPFPVQCIQGQYRLYKTSGQQPTCFGFLMAFWALGGDFMIERNHADLKRRFSWFNIEENLERAKTLAQKDKEWIDKRKIMTYEEYLNNRPWDCYPQNSLKGTVTGAR